MPGQPTVVLIGLDMALRTRLQRYFTQRHYHVAHAANGPEGRQAVRALGAKLVLLLPDLPAESGWLTAAKLRLEFPEVSVVFLVEEHDHRARQFAHFVGARVQLRQDDNFAGLTAFVARARSVAQN